jgi:hypothetical protein
VVLYWTAFVQEEVDATVETEEETIVLDTVEVVDVDELCDVVPLNIEVEELDSIELKIELIVEDDVVELVD